ncbi:DEAD/DEAH box helicase [Kocuria rosea]|uniref:DEAD/DEAH box helicase n=1 Tax=Kocuria rosea TaxID=1275 RepID=UPI000E06A328|nr:DEAD/DEAH box helicase [Kocuria rosea]STX07479.1 ATP-dependent helicase [Kocuria rosea]
MAELLPTLAAQSLQQGLSDYLSTTFSLTDPEARGEFEDFLADEQHGLFQGPFVRTRLPFESAAEGWRESLDWLPSWFTPYGHQAAAFRRLSSKPNAASSSDFRRPDPTLVVTGTGSGKTEAFLMPLIDHVLRAQARGVEGIKALILYPMNALANDQASRLAKLISDNPDLAGVRAALYTGQNGPSRTKVSADGLITDRGVMHDDPPDILLTNYKMLDMLLLRPADAAMWQRSSTSLQYVVLDEFHTYDGAQGTDVAMLLRRLGLALKSGWPEDLSRTPYGLTEEDRKRPLGRVTPVATSATLGAKGDPSTMLDFARTVFGETFPPDAVVTESRESIEEWCSGSAVMGFAESRAALSEVAGRIEELNAAVAEAMETAENPVEAVVPMLAREVFGLGIVGISATDLALDAVRAHPLVRAVLEHTQDGISLGELADKIFPTGMAARLDRDEVQEFLSHVVAFLSHLRFLHERSAPTVETHLWTRELTRVDKAVDATSRFRWGDDGVADAAEDGTDIQTLWLPAIFCRHCGRSGWGTVLKPTGEDLDADLSGIRRAAAHDDPRFRPLIYAPIEAQRASTASSDAGLGEEQLPGLRWFDARNRTLLVEAPDPDSEAVLNGEVLPVLTLAGPDVDDDAKDDVCPVCLTRDSIRFLGSAVATMLSVTISNLFSAAGLDAAEKKALVFTDSVQDAAHRAGFVQARSHVLTLRTALHRALDEGTTTLQELVDRLVQQAGDAGERYQLIPPVLADRKEFKDFWEKPKPPPRARRRVLDRLLFDAALEFGLQSRIGRTLELTGAVSAETDAEGNPAVLLSIARKAYESTATQQFLEAQEVTDAALLQWARGTLERIRVQGGIHHGWLNKYIQEDGNRWSLWGGRNRSVGMPAFPAGRPAPSFPRVGKTQGKDQAFDAVTTSRSWYARWASRTLGVPAADGAFLAKNLLAELHTELILQASTTKNGATVYSIPPGRVLLRSTESPRHLVCEVCRVQTPGSDTVVDQLDGAPCLQNTCPGTLEAQEIEPNYYRNLYSSSDLRRVVAREHTSLLKDEKRLAYEDHFRNSADHPDAPNVLVATPTLEMGIDIGDLSCVMLASLPTSVSSYIQRVGRAGRLTGNALILAFVRGRGQHLPKLRDPLSVINGDVRPPATYLNAEEILRRQYLARLADLLALDPQAPHPSRPTDVFSESDTSFLTALARLADESSAELLPAFLAAFSPLLSEEAARGLQDWTEPDETGCSPLRHRLLDALRRWTRDRDELRHRKQRIEESLDELREVAARPTATDEEVRALRSAEAALRRVRGQLSDHEVKEYWISAMERYGLLPNYTLVDDSVSLDVGVSWQDPDTMEFNSDRLEYRRGAASALTELAPGSTFYAQGLEVLIDAVDLGPEQSRVVRWQLCPACGWVNERVSEGVRVTSCARCQTPDIADTSQDLDVVPLAKVSAEVRRDEATINDTVDQRRTAVYSVAALADVVEKNVASRWFVEQNGFGVESLRSVDLRWLNMGRGDKNGLERYVAGRPFRAPLFRVCEYCGKLDNSTRRNSRSEHRAWCVHATAAEEQTVTVALARQLTTQGVLLFLPDYITVADSTSLPSLTSALLMGVRAVLGGEPDHLDIVPVSVGTSDGPRDGLLLHDTVPGGTGYLAGFASQEKVWDLLETAWQIVRDCPCRLENRLACHRCLLPFTRPWEMDKTSRATAERQLLQLLAATDRVSELSGEPRLRDWTVQHARLKTPETESHLEVRFREALAKRLATMGVSVQRTPGMYGDMLTFAFSGGPHTWTLEAQKLLPQAGTRPDFVLSTADFNIPDVAIYTDGYAFHATSAHNRVADDALKRRALREHGIIPWAVTDQDLNRFEDDAAQDPEPEWFRAQLTPKLMQDYTLVPDVVRAVPRNAVDRLLSWVRHPVRKDWAALADVVGLHLLSKPVKTDRERRLSWGRELLGEPAAPAPEGLDVAWAWTHGAVAAVFTGSPKNPSGITADLVLDDTSTGLAQHSQHEDWQTWLHLSTLLAFKTSGLTVTTASLIDAQTPMAPPSSFSEIALTPEWQDVLKDALDEEKELLEPLAAVDAIGVPELGYELSGEPIDIAWPDLQIGVLLDAEDGDARMAVLEADGWTVVEPTVESVKAAVAPHLVKDNA